ncbi:hypothetical protein SDC9_167955 [bioreactor metagenome]|uniref:Uncharacterized protein n=1 Tax=bioreactor metagenome TaxID=1076179 RepID=A0A645G367_9ZZZZ
MFLINLPQNIFIDTAENSCRGSIRLADAVPVTIPGSGYNPIAGFIQNCHITVILIHNFSQIIPYAGNQHMRPQYSLQFILLIINRVGSRNSEIIHHKMFVYRRKNWHVSFTCDLIPGTLTRVKCTGIQNTPASS